MSKAKDDTESEHWLTSETPDDWMDTTHERVYFRTEAASAALRSSAEAVVDGAATVAEALPATWTVVITGGPYRGYDVRYNSDTDTQRIHLDFYSVRPGLNYLEDIVDDVTAGLDGSVADETEGSA